MPKFTFKRSELSKLTDESIEAAFEATKEVPNDHLLMTREALDAVTKEFSRRVMDIKINHKLTYDEARRLAMERHRELFVLSRARAIASADVADIVVKP